MSSERYLLDTSALLTLIEDEVGADRVEFVLTHQQAIIPWVALLETHYITLQEQGRSEADRRYAMLKQLPVTFINGMDEPTLLTASRIKARHRLSFADAIIAAIALQQQTTLLHKDPEYEAVGDQVPLEALPYKREELDSGG